MYQITKTTNNIHTMENKYNLEVIQLESIKTPVFKEVRGKDWISFGADNKFPDLLIDLYNTSSIHATCINSKHDAVVGEGFALVGEEVVNADGETLNEVLDKAALDKLLYNGIALNVIWNRAGDKIVEIYHIPFDKVRSGRMNDEDKVEEYFYSSNWANTRKFTPVRYAAFSLTDNKGDNSSQIFYSFEYTPGNFTYPLPQYQSSLNDIQLDGRISVYHNSNLSNGISAGMIITFTQGEPSEDEKRMLYNDLTETFSGEENAGRLFLNFADGAENRPLIENLPSVNDDYYLLVNDRIISRVLTAHRISSPLLLGLKVEGGMGLGNNSEEIETAYTHFLSSVIQPIQRSLEKSFTRVLRPYGYNIKLEIIPNKLDFNKSINETPQL